MHGIGFRTADDIAVKLGLAHDSVPRLATGLKYVLAQAANENGHCYLPAGELLAQAAQILQASPEALPLALEQLRSERDVFIEPALPAQGPRQPGAGADGGEAAAWRELEEGEARVRVYFGPFWHAENGSARLLRQLCATPSILPPASQQLWNTIFARLAQNRAMHLTEMQRQAVQTAYTKKVSILTGGPGTGKSTSIRALLMLLRKRGIEVALAAPTGRAAKRLSEATGVRAKTLHRLLEFMPHDNSFQRDEEHPLPYQFVIVDEFSMVDILLFYHLLKALPRDAHLLLVGDADQLPSVGPGNVLRDLLCSEAIPAVCLSELFRQAQQSRIIVNAHRINSGQMPYLKTEADGDFFFLREEDPLNVQRLVVELVQRRLPARYKLNPMTDIQVLAPMYKGPAGVHVLNEELQARLNPRASAELEWKGHVLRSGDKVMQVRNDYDKGVFNGDMGWVRAISRENSSLDVEFLEEAGPLLVNYDFHELDELTLAYAVTVHKSQGSEYPAIVIPLTREHSMLLQRNLLYTAITRARRLCVLVGQARALEMAIRNDRVTKRYTGLAERLKI